MEFSTKVGRPETVKADAVVVGVHAEGELTATAKALDTAAGGALKAAVKSGDMTGKRGSQLLLRGLKGVAAPRVLLVGLGGKDDFNGEGVRRSGAREREGVRDRREGRRARRDRLEGEEPRRRVAGAHARDRRRARPRSAATN